MCNGEIIKISLKEKKEATSTWFMSEESHFNQIYVGLEFNYLSTASVSN